MHVTAERCLVVKDSECRSLIDILVPGDTVSVLNSRGITVNGKIVQIYQKHLCIKTEYNTDYNISFKRVELKYDQEHEFVIAIFKNGGHKTVNVASDSGTAMIKDIIKHIV